MFYEPPKANHDLPYSPFKALVAPRPIGWISTLSESGAANLAPYSFFNAIASNPDMVMFSSQQWKDTVTNIEKTGEFVCNYVTETMSDAMNASSVSAPYGVDEFEIAGLEKEVSTLVKPPRIAGIAAALECRMTRIIEIEDVEGKSSNHFMVIGQVMGTFINEAYLTNGRFDVTKARPLTRMGYHDYQHFGEIFELARPKWQD